MSRAFSWYHTLACFYIEFLLICVAVLLSVVLRISAGSLVLEHSLPYIPHAFLIAAVCQTCMYYTDMYDFRVSLSPSKLFVKLLQSLGVAGVVLAVFFYWLSQLVVGRRILLLSL